MDRFLFQLTFFYLLWIKSRACNRKNDSNGGALAFKALNIHSAVVQIDDLIADSQTQSRAFGSSGEKRLKNFV